MNAMLETISKMGDFYKSGQGNPAARLLLAISALAQEAKHLLQFLPIGGAAEAEPDLGPFTPPRRAGLLHFFPGWDIVERYFQSTGRIMIMKYIHTNAACLAFIQIPPP